MQRTEGYPTSSNFNLRLGVGFHSSDSLNGKSVGSATGGTRTAEWVELVGGWHLRVIVSAWHPNPIPS